MDNHLFTHPQKKLRKGNVFTIVCQEFCPGGGVQAHAQGEVGGLAGGVSRSDPGGRLGGSQGVSRPCGCPGPGPGGLSRPRPWGVYPSMH